MDLIMFHELDDSDSLMLDEYNQPVIRQRPESKSIANVILVTRLHAANPVMHHVIDKFIELYSITLQWDWFEQYQAWLVRKADDDPMPERPQHKTLEQYRAEILIDGVSIDEYLFRTQRAAAVKSITVEVDGLIFDGDEQSQRRMLAAIHASEDAGIESTIWRLAGNSEHIVTVKQIRQAHALSIIEQGKLWTRGVVSNDTRSI